MFLGGTMAEGWACYATDLMDEVGFLTPEESLAQQHTRARLLARAVVDIELHQRIARLRGRGRRSIAIASDVPEAAGAEACKNSMFPGTALMYWLGTDGLHQLRTRAPAGRRRVVLAPPLPRSGPLRSARFRCRCIAQADTRERVAARSLAVAIAGRVGAARRVRCDAAAAHATLQRSAHRRLRPRARHAQSLQHAHPRRHPDLRRRRPDDDRRADERRAAARDRGADAPERRRPARGPTAAWTSPGSCGPA